MCEKVQVAKRNGSKCTCEERRAAMQDGGGEQKRRERGRRKAAGHEDATAPAPRGAHSLGVQPGLTETTGG